MDSTTVPPLVVILGPTGSGKSALAMQAAKLLGGEIICADSRTVYKGMDIGTAKPSKADCAEVPHHLLDVVEPDKRFTASDFQDLANKAIEEIWQRGHLPIMVGGTGLYINSVLFGYQFGADVDAGFRVALNRMSVDKLKEYCRKFNIEIPVNENNKRHLVRAIEQNGINRNSYRSIRDNTLVLGLDVERDVLKKRLQARAIEMLKQNVVTEATILASKYGWECEALTGNIYRTLHKLIDGELSEKQAIERIVITDMQLAKRQITWHKRNEHIFWSNSKEELMQKILSFDNQARTDVQ
jgi:tRNA dimethylallyltransferase